MKLQRRKTDEPPIEKRDGNGRKFRQPERLRHGVVYALGLILGDEDRHFIGDELRDPLKGPRSDIPGRVPGRSGLFPLLLARGCLSPRRRRGSVYGVDDAEDVNADAAPARPGTSAASFAALMIIVTLTALTIHIGALRQANGIITMFSLGGPRDCARRGRACERHLHA